MSERLNDLANRQVELLRLLSIGPVCVMDLNEADAAHIVILQNRGFVEVDRDADGRVGACITAEGKLLSSRAV